VQVIPAIDIERGRSRVVFWPGVSTGIGAPTDRPERIAEQFVSLGAPLIHLVDFDGARRGAPVNTDAIGAIASRVATPIQLAGGLDSPEAIQVAFAAGATRVVVPLWAVAEDVSVLRACLAVASDWLAVGVDARSDRLAQYPWHGPAPTLDSLVAMLASEGVRRLVVSHWDASSVTLVAEAVRRHDLELQLAGGATDPGGVDAAHAAGADALILGEALFSGAIDFTSATRGVAING
jgi:phosphoribosylformimino-5-aminoimidazole carboxamide ribotide isomerase